MTNQEVVRALAVKVPVSSPVRSYRYIYEYCIVADEAGNTMNVAGLIDENGVLKYVDRRVRTRLFITAAAGRASRSGMAVRAVLGV